MKHVLRDSAYMRMYGGQKWQKVVALLFSVAYPLLSQFFTPCFKLYLDAIFCMFLYYDVAYSMLNNMLK